VHDAKNKPTIWQWQQEAFSN